MPTYLELTCAVVKAIMIVLLIDEKYVKSETTLAELGIDDVDYFEILLEVEDLINAHIYNDLFENQSGTVKELTDAIAKFLNVVIE